MTALTSYYYFTGSQRFKTHSLSDLVYSYINMYSYCKVTSQFMQLCRFPDMKGIIKYEVNCCWLSFVIVKPTKYDCFRPEWNNKYIFISVKLSIHICQWKGWLLHPNEFTVMLCVDGCMVSLQYVLHTLLVSSLN